IRTNGIIAINLQEEDQLFGAKISRGADHILLVTHEGKAIKFSEKDIRPTGRDTMGVMGLRLASKDDYAVTMEIFPEKFPEPEDKRRKHFQNLLVVMENGLGKQTPITDFPLQKRGGQGVKVAKVTDRTGKIVGAQFVTEAVNQIVLTTRS